MKPLRLALLIIAAAALATTAIIFVAPSPVTLRNTPPPWVVKHDEYHWQILGWSLEATTPAEVGARLGSDIQWAIVRHPGEPFALEGWLPDFAAQGITGKLLLHFALPEPLQKAAAGLATSAVRSLPSGGVSREFDPLRTDPSWATGPRLAQVAFIPGATLDEPTLTARFASLGTPQRWVDGAGDTHLLYALTCPAPCAPLGVHLVIPAERGRVLIEYAPYERLRKVVTP